MDRHRIQVATCGLLILLCAGAGVAQDVGDTVRARQEVDLRIEGEVVTAVAAGAELSVRKVSGKWLWVQTDSGARGWVLKEQVQRAEAPEDSSARPTARRPAPARSGSAEELTSDDPRLLAIGVLAGQNIYTTYAYIGSVADGYAYEVYDADSVQKLMEDISTMSTVAVENLRQVRDLNLADADRDSIDTVIDILKLLSVEADALAKYVRTNSDEDLEAYNDARNTVWPKVRDALNLE